MFSAGVVEAVYIVEDGQFCGPACWPGLSPDQLRLDGFDKAVSRPYSRRSNFTSKSGFFIKFVFYFSSKF